MVVCDSFPFMTADAERFTVYLIACSVSFLVRIT